MSNNVCYIYFLQIKNRDKFIKIGRTKCIKKRMNSLSCMPYELILLGLFECQSSAERAIHNYFRMDRISGEWFRPSKSLTKFIENCVKIGKIPQNFDGFSSEYYSENFYKTEIIKMYEEEYSLQRISEKAGISKQAISMHLKKYMPDYKNVSAKRRENKKQITQEKQRKNKIEKEKAKKPIETKGMSIENRVNIIKRYKSTPTGMRKNDMAKILAEEYNISIHRVRQLVEKGPWPKGGMIPSRGK